MIKKSFQGLAGSSLKARILRGGVGTLAIKLANIPLGFVVTLILARTLGAEGYGVYAYSLAIVAMIGIPAKLGLPQVVVRETAKTYALKRWGEMAGLWGWADRVGLVSSILIVALAVFATLFFPVNIEKDVLFVALSLVPLVVTLNIKSAALRGLHQVIYGQIPESVIKPLFFILVITAWYLISGEGIKSPFQAMLFYVLSTTIALVASWWLLFLHSPRFELKSSERTLKGKEWLRSALPLAFVGGMAFINQNADIMLLGALSSIENVGIYKVASQIALLVMLGQQVVHIAVSPYFAKAYAENDIILLQKMAINSAKASFLCAALFGVPFIIFGGEIMGLIFGKEYAAGYYALTILIVAKVFNAGMGALGVLLNMTGHEKCVAKTVVWAVLINIILNIILIPRFGIEGAAVATATSIVIWNILLSKQVKDKLGIKISAFLFFK